MGYDVAMDKAPRSSKKLSSQREASASKKSRPVPTKKPPTIHDVARLSGVSTATVSRFFSGKLSVILPQTIERVREAAQTLGYTPSQIGRSLRLADSRVVVMLVPDATNFFTADVAASVESALQKIGLSMVLGNTAETAEKQDQLLADAQGLRARAIVLQGAIDTPMLREIAAQRRNVVFVNRRPAPGIASPYVGIDNFKAGLAVGKYFVKRGYTNCVAIHGPRHYPGSSERLEGFLKGIGNRKPIFQFECLFSMEAGYQQGQLLLSDCSQRFAVFCANDMIAYGLYRVAKERGLRVPEDLVIFGFDDNRVNNWLAPWLSTIRVPAFDFGPAVVDLIKMASSGMPEKRVILPFEIIIRQSA